MFQHLKMKSQIDKNVEIIVQLCWLAQLFPISVYVYKILKISTMV